MPDSQARSEPTPPPGLPAVSVGVERQMEIYQAGLRGEQPALPLSAEELELRARAVPDVRRLLK